MHSSSGNSHLPEAQRFLREEQTDVVSGKESASAESGGKRALNSINGHTRLVGLLGWPVEHTISPAMHNAAFLAAGLNWRYVPLPVRPGRVAQAMSGLQALGFAGCNVTIPHKRAVMEHLDHASDQAQAIGAVNTVVIKPDGRMLGDNTDAAGFLRSLVESGFHPQRRRAMVIGAGGSARAVANALASVGTSITIVNRTLSRAESLVADLSSLYPSLPILSRRLTPAVLCQEILSNHLLVNATSMGMWPQVDCSPWPDGVSLPSSLMVFDLVYTPPETKLMKQARRAGARAIGGLEMLVYQGVAAWELWTDQRAPVDTMMTAARAALQAI